MANQKVRVAVNGYGVIGKRIADAVALQDDIELVGVVDVVSDWRIKVAVEKGHTVFASSSEATDAMRAAGIPVAGHLDDLLRQVDVIADATPKKVASANLEKYCAAGIKSIFQGSEKHSLTGHSFVAQSNYGTALGRDITRVVSCNSTSIVHTLGALKCAGLLEKVRGVLIRRATDPWESDHSGIMNTVVPEKTIPSHQGPDAQTVAPDLDVITIAVVGAHTTSHLHAWSVELTRSASKDEVLAAFRSVLRIVFLHMADGIVALNSTLEPMESAPRAHVDMVALSLDEVIAKLQFLVQPHRAGKSVWRTFWLGGNALGNDLTVHRQEIRRPREMFWGVTLQWTLLVNIAFSVRSSKIKNMYGIWNPLID